MVPPPNSGGISIGVPIVPLASRWNANQPSSSLWRLFLVNRHPPSIRKAELDESRPRKSSTSRLIPRPTLFPPRRKAESVVAKNQPRSRYAFSQGRSDFSLSAANTVPDRIMHTLSIQIKQQLFFIVASFYSKELPL